MGAREERGGWGGIARAMEEGAMGGGSFADTAHEEMYPGHREAAREAGAAGILGLISGRHKDFIESNKAQMRELGITPSYRDREGNLTGRYSSGDWQALQDALAGDQAVTTGLGSSDLTAEELRDSRLGPHTGRLASPFDPMARLEEQKSIGAGNPQWEGTTSIDPAILEKLSRDPAWIDKPSQSMGIQDRFGDRTFSPRGRTSQGIAGGRQFGPGTQMDTSGAVGYFPGRMSVGEARRARAMRSMSIRDRQEAGFSGYDRTGNYSEWDRISHLFDERMGRMKDKLRDWDIEDRTKRPGMMGGGPSTRIQPDWGAIEAMLEREAIRGRHEREYEGRE